MAKKSDYICVTPFNYTEVHDKEQWLCCPSWLPVDIEQGLGIKENFRSEKAEKVRDSIIDGSYKYCDELLCPHLSGIKNNKISNFYPISMFLQYICSNYLAELLECFLRPIMHNIVYLSL